MSIHLVIPFLRPIEVYLLDPTVSEIMVNANRSIYIERHGIVSRAGEWTADQKTLEYALQRIARLCGDEIDEHQPQLNARLSDGSRVAGLLPPCSVGGVQLTIRKFQKQFFSLGALVDCGTLSERAADILRAAISQRQNLLISGATGAGKTTLANALVNLIPSTERIGIIEETAEIQIEADNVFRFEARRHQPGFQEITQRDLLRFALRHRPDRLFIGEVLGPEAMDLLELLNTGHTGSLATIHANFAEDALARLISLAGDSGSSLSELSIQKRIGRLIQLVVQIVRRDGQRYVSEILRVHRFDVAGSQFATDVLYHHDHANRGASAVA